VTDISYKYISGLASVQISERFDIVLVCKLQVSGAMAMCPKSRGYLSYSITKFARYEYKFVSQSDCLLQSSVRLNVTLRIIISLGTINGIL
jgi:hypothetical protein